MYKVIRVRLTMIDSILGTASGDPALPESGQRMGKYNSVSGRELSEIYRQRRYADRLGQI